MTVVPGIEMIAKARVESWICRSCRFYEGNIVQSNPYEVQMQHYMIQNLFELKSIDRLDFFFCRFWFFLVFIFFLSFYAFFCFYFII